MAPACPGTTDVGIQMIDQSWKLLEVLLWRSCSLGTEDNIPAQSLLSHSWGWLRPPVSIHRGPMKFAMCTHPHFFHSSRGLCGWRCCHFCAVSGREDSSYFYYVCCFASDRRRSCAQPECWEDAHHRPRTPDAAHWTCCAKGCAERYLWWLLKNQKNNDT